MTERYYTKTIQFHDITYQLAQNDEKTSIFENWCDFLNYYDSSISIQLSFINHTLNEKIFQRSIEIPDKDDEFNEVRQEYAEMLKGQLAKGNNGRVKQKYLTFGIEADNLKTAKARLNRIEMDIKNNFKVLGVRNATLDGKERLELLYNTFHLDTKEPFAFDWDMLHETGLSTKDLIAPTSFDFKDSRSFAMGRTQGAVSFLQILAPEMSDRLLADYLDMDGDLILNLHIHSIDQNEAIKLVKRKITDLDAMKIQEQKKAVRAGYDMEIIPSDLMTYGSEAKKLLDELQSRNERMFLVTILVMNVANDKQKLEDYAFQAAGVAQKYNCSLRRLDFQQENALVSSLPLGLNRIEINRALTSSSTAIFVPFTTQEIFMGKGSLYYGLNALSNNMIMGDRKKLKNPNGLILGSPGSGKSFSAKREITNSFLITDDSILICDPESEYTALVEELGGQIIKISMDSEHHINPLDINSNYGESRDPVRLKCGFILSFFELVLDRPLEAKEKSLIDRCSSNVYKPYIRKPCPENIPILEDLYNELLEQPNREVKQLAVALELYVTGSLKVFNNRTNINLDSRIVCFDTRELGTHMTTIAMLIVQDQVWNRVTVNRFEKGGRSTRYYIDEFHLLFKKPQTASYSVEIWKRFRKWGGIPTGITQNVKEFLDVGEIENILDNSDFIYMLSQPPGDRQKLAERLNISPHQLSYITDSNEGEGLIFFGGTIIPFTDAFPKDLKLYKILTTKIDEVNAREKEAVSDE